MSTDILEDFSNHPHFLNLKDVTQLWEEFRADFDGELREKLISLYLPFARMLAAKMFANRTFLGLEFLDFFQYASLGLIEAIDRFDPSVGVKFETFATYRINGAILNGLESLSEKQEQVSARKRIMSNRVNSLAAGTINVNDPDMLFGHLAELAIGLAVGFALEDSGMYQAEEFLSADTTYRRTELKQINLRIRSLLESLPQNEKRVLSYHYLQHVAFEEIALILKISKSRVSQIHKEALKRLKLNFVHQDDFDLSY